MVLQKIIALHGFLGSQFDFKPLGLNNLFAINIFNTQLCPLNQWAKRFNNNINSRPILMGYSMGGRLALHCLLENPSLYSAAIILAAHPGLNSFKKKQDRLLADLSLATRFLSLPWADLMRDWMQTPVLSSSKVVIRKEEDFSRRALASSLRYFSLGRQDFLIPELNELRLPILWLSPSEEYQKIENLKLLHSRSQILHIASGGHRFMFENPQLVREIITRFLHNLGIA